MKVMFTADWHIKLGQKNVPVQWAKDRFHALFGQLHQHSTECDLHIIGGDIFDKLPSMEELELYFDFISAVRIPTIIYPGNHEALKKNTTFLTNMKRSSEWVNSRVRIVDGFESLDEYSIDIIPYNKLKEYTPSVDLNNRILCTHVRGEIPPHVKPEVPLELFDRWDVVLAGDLHSYDNCQRNILYPGSPVTTSFHRNRVDTGFIILDTETLEHEWKKLELPQLIRKTIRAGEPMPATDYDHTIYEVEGDMAELSTLESSELLDKKVVKRETDTALILNADMSLVEEVEEYLKYILQLPDETVATVIKELNNYVE